MHSLYSNRSQLKQHIPLTSRKSSNTILTSSLYYFLPLQVKEEMLLEALTTRKTVTVGERLIVPYKLAEVTFLITATSTYSITLTCDTYPLKHNDFTVHMPRLKTHGKHLPCSFHPFIQDAGRLCSFRACYY